MRENPQLADPWAAQRHLPGTPDLVAYVHARPTRYGGSVMLSAALWGGHYERSVKLDVHQARVLSRELQQLADALAQGHARSRREARERARGRVASQLAGGPRRGAATPAGAYGRGADVDSTPIRPMARSGSVE